MCRECIKMMKACGKMPSKAWLNKFGVHQSMKGQFTIKYFIFREIWKISCVVQIFPVLYLNSLFPSAVATLSNANWSSRIPVKLNASLQIITNLRESSMLANPSESSLLGNPVTYIWCLVQSNHQTSVVGKWFKHVFFPSASCLKQNANRQQSYLNDLSKMAVSSGLCSTLNEIVTTRVKSIQEWTKVLMNGYMT